VDSTSNAAGAHAVSASGSNKGLGSRTVSPGLVLALTSVAFFMVSLDALVVVTALPAIHRSIGGAIGTLEWAVNAYGLTFAAGIITAASLGERLGRRRVYATGLVVFTLASAACAVAPNASLLIAARAVQGLGAAAVTPLALTILAAAFPVERRGAVVGIFGGISGLAVAGGPLVGGAVTQGLDWHWIFWINVPFGVAAVVGSLLFLPAGRAAVGSGLASSGSGSGSGSGLGRLDVPGAVLSAGGGALLAWGLVRVGGSGWGDALGLACVFGGLAVLAAFVAWERRAASPMMPLRLFRVRAFAAANVTGFMSFGAIMSAAFLTAQYFQLGLGYSPLSAGLRMLPWTATPMIVAPVAGALADRIGTRPLLTVGLTLQAGGLAWVALLASAGAGGYGRYVVPFVIAGVGISMAIPTVPTAALSAVAPADVGRASGVSNTMQRFGGAFGVALVSAVFAGSGHLGTAASFTAGYRPAMLGAAGLSLLGALAAVAIGRRRSSVDAVPATTETAGPHATTAAGEAGTLAGADA
jgi:EmrB/QacA subfamily drug resistance transporter